MKVVILAGGTGTRLYEETKSKPKPLVELGGIPILWHIIKYYLHSGLNDFVICTGYKGNMIIDFFDTLFFSKQKVLKFGVTQSIVYENDKCKITIADTGEETMTGGRLKRISHLLKDERFFVSYGDTLSNVNIKKSMVFHLKQNAIATLTAIHPTSRYGVLSFDSSKDRVSKFEEKPVDKSKWVNGGYYIFEPEILNLIKDDDTSLENEPLQLIAEQEQLAAYRHNGFWASMETYKDKLHLEALLKSNNAPWKVWNDALTLGKVL